MLESLLSCPVCLGTTMAKLSIGPGGSLQVDHCGRCGGFWLEHGEVQRLRALKQSELWSAVPHRPHGFKMRCHDCHAFMERAAQACDACGWLNALDCPGCDRPMLGESHAGLRLDVCRECKGVWFDHHEVQAIWESSFDSALKARGPERGGGTAVAADVAGDVLLNSLFFAPDLVFYGARAMGDVAVASAGMMAHLPEAIGAAPEAAGSILAAAGEAAGSVFEVIVSIIAGIFEGL